MSYGRRIIVYETQNHILAYFKGKLKICINVDYILYWICFSLKILSLEILNKLFEVELLLMIVLNFLFIHDPDLFKYYALYLVSLFI